MTSSRASGLALVLSLAAATAHIAAQMAPAWPTRGWAAASAESLGFTPGALEALDREFAAGKHGYVDSMLVIRHGKVAFEGSYTHDYDRLFAGKGEPGIYNYYDPAWHPFYKRTPLHTMQSVSKSVTSALIGIAIARGEIAGLDVPVMPYFAAFKVKPDPRRDRMTLRHVLTMTTGIQWDESSTSYTNSKNNCAEMEAADDWIQYVLDQPMAAEPGTTWVYNSGATQLLSYILEKVTGQKADDYAKAHLFGPLGVEFFWKRTPKGLADTEGGLYLRPRDLAKFGYLYLKGGMWEGRQIVPADFVKQSVRWHHDAERVARGYGYKWWVLTRKGAGTYDAFAAIGYGGQRLIVVPELDLIAVFTGWNIYDKPELNPRFALDRVVAAVKEAHASR